METRKHAISTTYGRKNKHTYKCLSPKSYSTYLHAPMTREPLLTSPHHPKAVSAGSRHGYQLPLPLA